MECPKCQAENQHGAAFCSLCFTSFEGPDSASVISENTEKTEIDPSKFDLKNARFKSKVYQSKALSFAQDRCQSSWRWSKDLDFNNSEVANVHLVVENDALQNQLDMLQVGDQIKLKGQLVNVKAKAIGETGSHEPGDVQLNSSTTREDSGPGACEIISVKSVEVLKKSNFMANSLFSFSYLSLALLTISNIAIFFVRTLPSPLN
ncbi:MAG: zinc ribbon domain-containing protein [Actinomycetia bacterium]|nr:zinc ribbon domain-containing protein [Actinomycetes bacterium]